MAKFVTRAFEETTVLYHTMNADGYANPAETIVFPSRKDAEQARAALQIKSKLFVVVDSVETTSENRRMTVEAFKANSEVY